MSVVNDVNGLVKTLAVIVLLIFVYEFAKNKGWFALPASPIAAIAPVPSGPGVTSTGAVIPSSWSDYIDPAYWLSFLTTWKSADAAPPAPVPNYLTPVDMSDFNAGANWQPTS